MRSPIHPSEDFLYLLQILFGVIPTDLDESFAAQIRTGGYPAGALILHEGEIGRRFYLIREGRLAVVKGVDSAQERQLRVLSAGEYFGEMSLLDPMGMRSASIRAISDSRTVEIPLEALDALMKRYPTHAIGFLRKAAARLLLTENEMISELRETNRALTQAYRELQAAQLEQIAAEKLETELNIAHDIQKNSLPTELPLVPGWSIEVFWQPARAVGGDFYDFIPLPDGKLAIVIGDVTDKGVPAALVMAMARSVLRTLAQRLDTPAEILAQTNRALYPQTPRSMFTTCQVLILDPYTGKGKLANAGHNLPLHDYHGVSEELHATGMPLGWFPETQYDELTVSFTPGSRILLFSDGLVEARNPQKELYGFPRLRHQFSQCSSGPGLVQHLLQNLQLFTGAGWEQEDDISVVSLHWVSAEQRDNQGSDRI